MSDPIVERTLPPPLTEVAVSSDIVSQSLEILPVFLEGARIVWLKPIHADSLRVGLPPSKQPADVILSTMARYGMEPIVVHSTSWRSTPDRMILTYVVVVPPMDVDAAGSLTAVTVGRADLARGEATAAPKVIGVDQVIEHALRHLAWLVRDDPAVGSALAGWHEVLNGYVAEPFRAFQA